MRSSRASCRLVAATAALLGACGGGGGSSADAGAGATDARPADAGGPATAVFAPPAVGEAVDWGVVPYPSDLYVVDGKLRLAALPVGANSDPSSETMLRETLAQQDGPGVWSNVYFRIAGDLDPATLAGNAKLVALDDGLAEVPADVLWRPDLGVVVIAPTWGSILREDTRYAAWLTGGVKSVDGQPLAASADFVVARDLAGAPADPALARAQESLRPLLEHASAPAAGDLAVATVFRTQHVSRDTKAMRDIVAAAPPAFVSVESIWSTPAELDFIFGAQDPTAAPGFAFGEQRAQPHGHVGAVVHLRVKLKSFIHAEPGKQGFITLDAMGKPEVKGEHDVVFTLFLPKQASWADLPVVISIPGLNVSRQFALPLADTFNARGIAVLAFDVMHHGSRANSAKDVKNDATGAAMPDGFGDLIGLTAAAAFFNLIGSVDVPAAHQRAMRDNMRQSAIDICSFVSWIAGGDLTGLRAALAGEVGLPADPATLGFRDDSALVAESFGALLGGVAVAVEPRVSAVAFTSAAAGFPYPSVLHSAYFSGTFTGVVMAPFDVASRVELGDATRGARFDPLVNLYNQAIEQGDPAAYAPTVLAGSLRGGDRPDFLLAQPWSDETVSNHATEMYASTLGLPYLSMAAPEDPPPPATRYVSFPAPIPTPVTGNLAGGRTGGFLVYHPASHAFLRSVRLESAFLPGFPPFVPRTPEIVFDQPIVQLHAQIGRFLADVFAGEVPTIIDPYAPMP